MKSPRRIAEAIMARAFGITREQRARDYAANLYAGAMLFDYDLDEVADFRFELVRALHDRGLETEPIEGGHVVVEKYKAPVAGIVMDCRDCPGNWMYCGCGVGAVFVMGKATLPAMVGGRAQG